MTETETKAAHTPGSWHFDPRTGEISAPRDGGSIAMVLMGAEGPANARLIAAAPDMLEALERSQALLSDLTSPEQTKADGVNVKTFFARCREVELDARAAIARAKGGAA